MEGALVDDARVVGRRLGALGVELLVRLLEFFNHGGQDRLIDHGVVVRGANLASVETLAPEKSPRDQAGVGGLGSDGRVDTAQFEHDRGQMGSGGLGDDATDGGTTGEEDLVPALGKQGLGLGNGALDEGVARGVESGLDDPLHDDGTVRSILAGLDGDGVTGGDGTKDGSKSELEGEVEGTALH